MSQSRARSGHEAIANTVIGYGLAVAIQPLAFPLFGIPPLPVQSHLAIGAIFFGVSMVRSYAIRRAFNAWETP